MKDKGFMRAHTRWNDGVYCTKCSHHVDGNGCCSLGCDADPRLNEHPVDALMGSGGDPLLATGTRSMWVGLFDQHLAELQRYREREPLVHRLISEVRAIRAVHLAEGNAAWFAREVAEFQLTPSVKCPSQADGSADDLTPATPITSAKSRRKSGADAG